MRNWFLIVTWGALCCLCGTTGCDGTSYVVSSHPFFTAEDVVWDQSVLGTWVYEDANGSPARWEFIDADAFDSSYESAESGEPADAATATPDTSGETTAGDSEERSYRYYLRNTDIAGLPYVFTAQLFELDGRRYMDIAPCEDWMPIVSDDESVAHKRNAMLSMHTLVAHTLWQIEYDGTILELAGLYTSAVDTYEERQGETLDRDTWETGGFDVLYAPAEELREFVRVCGKLHNTFQTGQILLSRAGAQSPLPQAQVAWRASTYDSEYMSCVALPAGGLAYFTDQGQGVFLDAAGNEVTRLQQANWAPGSAVCLSDGRVYISRSQPGIDAFENTGRLAWSAGSLATGCQPIGLSADGLLYAISLGHYADFSPGYEDDQPQDPPTTDITLIPASEESAALMFIPARDTQVAVLGADGAAVSNFSASPGLLECAAVSPTGVLYCGWVNSSERIRRINAYDQTGKLLWSSHVRYRPRELRVTPNGTIVAACGSAGLIAWNADGSPAWTFPAPGAKAELAAISYEDFALASDGSIYTTSGRVLYALSQDGALKWQLKLPRYLDEPLLGPGGRVYCQALPGGTLETLELGEAGTYSRLIAVYPDGILLGQWQLPDRVIVLGIGPSGEVYAQAETPTPAESSPETTPSKHDALRLDLP